MATTWIFSAIRQSPLVFNGITGGVLCASSDAMAQQLEQQQQKFDDNDDGSNSSFMASSPSYASLHLFRNTISNIDWLRCASAGMIGIFFGGMVYPHAYAKLDSIWIGTNFQTVLKKSMVEIATVGIFVNSLSMASRGICRPATTPKEVVQHVLDELPTVTRNDVVVWLPYNLLAFSFIPPMIRPTTTAFMEASWQTYISLRSHDYNENDDETKSNSSNNFNEIKNPNNKVQHNNNNNGNGLVKISE